MSGPAAQGITVTAQQAAVLERVIRRRTGSQQEVLRARIILADVGGKQPTAVGRAVGVTGETSRLWRARQEARLAAEVEGGDAAVEVVIRDILGDESRSGRPATFSPEQVCQILALACEPPEALGRPMAHWTPRELADEAVHRGIVPRISPPVWGVF